MPFGLDKPVENVVGVIPCPTSRITFPPLVSKISPVAARKVVAPNGIAAKATRASRKREKIVLVMVCFFEVPGNVPSEGRSSTFEYRKRKKPRGALFVAPPARLTSDLRICRPPMLPDQSKR